MYSPFGPDTTHHTTGPVILLYSSDTRMSVNLSTIGRGRAALVPCNDATSFCFAAERAINGAVIVGVMTSHNHEFVDAVRAMRRRFPAIPLLLVAPDSHARPADAFEVSGVAAVCRADVVMENRSEDIDRALGPLLDRADQVSPAGRVMAFVDATRPDLDRTIREFISIALRGSRHVRTVSDVARILGLSLRTIERRHRDAGLPPARETLGWISVVRAVFMLQDPNCTLKRVVECLPFSDIAAVGARCRRYAGRAPSAMRDASAITYLFEHQRQEWQRRALSGQPDRACC